MKCTHNCKTCKCNINDVNGFPCCIYFGTIINDIHWVTNFLTGHALEYFTKNRLYFYDDGLYLYDPKTCWLKKENYKMRKSACDCSDVTNKKYCFMFDKVGSDWVEKNSR